MDELCGNDDMVVGRPLLLAVDAAAATGGRGGGGDSDSTADDMLMIKGVILLLRSLVACFGRGRAHSSQMKSEWCVVLHVRLRRVAAGGRRLLNDEC